MKYVFMKTVVFSDDVKIRWLMGLASLGWAFELWLEPEFLDRKFFSVMKATLSPNVWAILFFIHGAGAVWRIFERKERKGWALFINGLGVAVWVASTVAQNLVGGMTVPTSALETFACVFLFITFVSTGFITKSTTT